MSEGLRNERKLFTHPGAFERLLYVTAGAEKGVAQIVKTVTIPEIIRANLYDIESLP